MHPFIAGFLYDNENQFINFRYIVNKNKLIES